MKKTKGVLTVEATLIFPVFILLFAFMINSMNMYFVNILMQNAINNLSREISEVYYIVDSAENNVDFEQVLLNAKADENFMRDVEKLNDSLKILNTSIANENNSVSLTDVINNAVNSSESIENAIKTIVDYNVEISDLAVGIVLGEIAGKLNTNGGNIEKQFIEILFKEYLQEMNANVLSKVYDIESVGPKISSNANKDITITISYKFKNLFKIGGIGDIDMVNTVTVHPWIGGKYSD